MMMTKIYYLSLLLLFSDDDENWLLVILKLRPIYWFCVPLPTLLQASEYIEDKNVTNIFMSKKFDSSDQTF